MSETSGSDGPYLPGAGKKASPNVSSGWIVMVLSGLIAMVIFIYATQQGGTRFSVAVPTERIDPGEKVNPGMFREVEVNVPEAQLNRLLRFEDLQRFDGFVSSAVFEPGELVNHALLVESVVEQLRAMTIPVARERAADGALRTGDRVDVLGDKDDVSYVAAYDLEVLSVNAGGGSGIAGGQNFSVTVAVTPEEAVALSRAINDGSHSVIKSTGSAPLLNPRALTNNGSAAGVAP